MTDKELIEFYEKHKEHYVTVYSYVDFDITLEDLFKMFKLLIKKEQNKTKEREEG